MWLMTHTPVIHTMLQSPLLGDICIWHMPQCQFVADVRGHDLLVWGSAKQYGCLPSCICQQKSVQHGVAVQQHWERSTRHTTLAQSSTITVCKESMYHHLPQTAGGQDQQGHGKIVTATKVHHAGYTLVQHAYAIQTKSKLYVAFWLLHHNQVENWDQEMPGMNTSIHNISTPVDVPACTSIEDIRVAMEEDLELEMLQWYIISGCPPTREEWSQG